VGGSLASSVWGRARSTLDVDLVADIHEGHVLPICSALESDYYVSDAAMREALARRTSFNLIHFDTMVKIDVFTLASSPFDRASFQRFQTEEIGELNQVRFCTAEDMILRKLDWYRQGGEVSTKQWDDILGILEVQGDALDTGYLDRWSKELSVADLLNRARMEANH